MTASSASLFVADVGSNSIARYTLKDGFPISPPISSVLLPGPPQAFSVAPDGSLYVSVVGVKGLSVFGPRAHGRASPLRSLQLDFVPRAVVANIDYVYLAREFDFVDIYFANANGHTAPISRFAIHSGSQNRDRIVSMNFDALGRLYVCIVRVQGDYPSILAFVNPMLTPGSTILQSSINDFAFGMAFDENDELYDARGDIVAYEPIASGAYPVDRYLARSSVSFSAQGVALLGRHAFVSSSGDAVTPAVYVFDALRAGAPPLQVLTGADLIRPSALAVLP